MKDPSFEIREKTVIILGRLADNNKSILYPYLRNLLVTVMSTIEYKSDPKEKEEAIKILKTLIKKCKRVVKDHIECLLKSLLDRMEEEDFNYSLLPDIIEAIGQLSVIDGRPIIPYLDKLIPLILDCVKDEISSKKREIGIRVLIMVIENTGYVVKPYFHYPETISLLQTLIQNETSLHIRKQVYKLLGTIGALDPYLIKKIFVFISVEADEELALNLPLLKEIDKQEKFSNKSSIKNLNKHVLLASKEINADSKKTKGISGSTGIPLEHLGNILQNLTLRDIHKTVLESIDFIFDKVKEHTKSYLHLLYPPLQYIIRNTSDDALRKLTFKILQKLIFRVGYHIARYSISIFALINEFLDTEMGKIDKIGEGVMIQTSHYSQTNYLSMQKSCLNEVLEIILTLNSNAKAYVKDYIYFLIPKILQILEKNK